ADALCWEGGVAGGPRRDRYGVAAPFQASGLALTSPHQGELWDVPAWAWGVPGARYRLRLRARTVLAWCLAHQKALWPCAPRRGPALGKRRVLVGDQR